MTFGKFKRLYNVYRDDFDLEMTMRAKGIRYSELTKEVTINDVIPF